jgi:hypothetical protein
MTIWTARQFDAATFLLRFMASPNRVRSQLAFVQPNNVLEADAIAGGAVLSQRAAQLNR